MMYTPGIATPSASGHSGGGTPAIYRNDVLAIEVYPDSGDTLSQNGTTKVWSITTDTGDHVAYTYDVMGRRTTQTDQRGVEHTYAYNNATGVGAGQLLSDAVTTLPGAGTPGRRPPGSLGGDLRINELTN